MIWYDMIWYDMIWCDMISSIKTIQNLSNIAATHTHTGHTGFTFTLSFPADFTWSLSLVETAYPIVNMFQVINKEARAT